MVFELVLLRKCTQRLRAPETMGGWLSRSCSDAAFEMDKAAPQSDHEMRSQVPSDDAILQAASSKRQCSGRRRCLPRPERAGPSGSRRLRGTFGRARQEAKEGGEGPYHWVWECRL